MVRRIILTIGFVALAASALAQQSGVPIGLPDTRRIEAFSNGDIRHSSSADVYFMVVQATDNAGQFWLQCEKRGPFTVAVAMVGATDKLQRSQVVTIRPDGGATRKLDLIVFENFVAIATRFEGKADENASVFMDTLNSAKQTFTIGYAGVSHDFEVSHLSAPRARFQALCTRQGP